MTNGRRVLIFGTGAAATAFGARLARSGADVTLAGRWREAREALARDGALVDGGGAPLRAALRTADVDEPHEPAELVLVLVKAYRTADVAGAAAKAVAPGGLVLTLQNGLGNRETLAAAAGAHRVAVGVTRAGFTLVGPGHVRAFPGLTLLGRTPAVGPLVDRAAALLRDTGAQTETTPDIASALWSKLAVNCAINALGATLRVPNGELLRYPDARDTLVRAAREVGAVAAARGIHLDDPAALALRVAADTAENRSSMLQDVDRGAPTEIDALNGAVLMEGARLGVPTPVNESLWRGVKEIEAR